MQQHTPISGQQTSLFTREDAISSQWAYPVNPTAQQVNAWEKKMNATSGRRVLEQYGRYPRAGSFSKTFAALLIGMEEWSSTRCRLTWSLRATRSHRFYFLLQVSTLRIEETGFGLLPTPQVFDANGTFLPGKHYNGQNKHAEKLGQAVMRLLPTPRSSPNENRQTKLTPSQKAGKHGLSLAAVMNQDPGSTSLLNPRFVLEMMGFPPNWTELPWTTGAKNQ